MSTDLKNKISAITSPIIGEIYFHFRDINREQPYRVKAIALREESLEPTVIYEALYGEKLVWDRLLKDWNTSVLFQNEIVPRFVKE